MVASKVTIAFARRGYSASGGAEAYLKRLAEGIREMGYATRLYASDDWPAQDTTFDEIVRVPGSSALAFANNLDTQRPRNSGELLISLERVCRCDVYRAGDGVHQAWLNRRAKLEG